MWLVELIRFLQVSSFTLRVVRCTVLRTVQLRSEKHQKEGEGQHKLNNSKKNKQTNK